MANEQSADKPAATGRKPPRNERPPQSQPPQVQPPLLSDGPELVRDTHC
ncbi:hypothetical protein V1279_004162 [Bradyrhizobium sp. AZCC 1610]